MGGRPVGVKVLTLRRDDACVACATPLPAGSRAGWDATDRTTRCLTCVDGGPAPDAAPPAVPRPRAAEVPTPGRAGVSAQREHDRRAAARDARVRARHPRLGGLILALSDEPTSTRVWQQGARGERAVAEAVEALAPDVVGLHDRRLRRPDGRLSTANIDHLVVTPAGVWVVDAKTHTGRLEVRRAGGLLRPRTERLVIRGRDQSRLLDGLATQVSAVTAELERVGANLPVRGALCFVGTELPWGGETVAGVPLVGRRGLTKLLRRPGDLAVEERAAVAAYLAARFPTAG